MDTLVYNRKTQPDRACEQMPEGSLKCSLYRCIKDCCKPKGDYRTPIVHPLADVKPESCPFGMHKRKELI